MPNDNTHTLLPCPFCGADALAGQSRERGFFVQCVLQDCEASVDHFNGPDNAAEAWNTRTPAEPKAGCEGYMCNRGADGTNGPFHYGCDTCGRTLSSMNPCYSGEMCIHVPHAEPKAGDWEELEDFIAKEADPFTLSGETIRNNPQWLGPFMWLSDVDFVVKETVRRALSSAAPRITEDQFREQVEHALEGGVIDDPEAIRSTFAKKRVMRITSGT